MTELNKYEKLRLRLKIMWEGGLSGYIDYGVARCLHQKFKEEFDEIFKLDKEIYELEKIEQFNKNVNKKRRAFKILIHKLTSKIEKYLDGNIDFFNMSSIDSKEYEGVDLNDYNYILDL